MNQVIDRKPRYDWIDIVKSVGIFAIVWSHTMSRCDVYHYLCSFHVPIFFFVIGLYFTSSKEGFWSFTKKKAYSLLLPYAVFATVSILIFAVLGKFAASSLGSDASSEGILGDLLEMLTGSCRANRPLWFLPSFFVFYLICFWLVKLADKHSVLVRNIIMTVVATASMLLCFLNEETLKLNGIFWKADAAVFMLAFFAVAVMLKPILQRKLKAWINALASVALLVCGAALAFSNSVIYCLENNYGNVFLFYLSALCTIVGFCFLAKLICDLPIVSTALIYIGKRTLPILLMHKFPILFFQIVFPWTKQPLKDNNLLICLAVAIVSIAACLLVELFLARFLPFLIGKPIRKKTQEQ